MSNVMKLSDAASIAIHAAVYLAAQTPKVCSAPDIARALHVSQAHLIKVLQRLTRAHLVTASRGPKGGFSLARPADSITLKEVFEGIEGELTPVRCLLKHPLCDGTACILGSLVQQINKQSLSYFNDKTLAMLVNVFNTNK